ncbi:gamma-glutamyltranspeptidase [Blastocladiella britannica]|nr:gamma-glutamyltranspeptidase [Blastocladiella britannica]
MEAGRGLLGDFRIKLGEPLDNDDDLATKRRTRHTRAFAAIALAALATTLVVSVTSSCHGETAAAAAGRRAAWLSPSSVDAPRIFGRAAVASEVPVCSTIGKNLLATGGSAVDAAIGTALCVGSIHSFASGIGGGGFMLIRPTTESGYAPTVVDFRETAPRAINESLYHGDARRAQVGGLAVGVPGELRGFELAHKRHGKLPWSHIIAPVVALNRDGFVVTQTLAVRLATHASWILKSKVWSSVFAPTGTLVVAGDVVKRTVFAETLARIAAEGVEPFYSGDIGAALVAAARSDGGVISEKDFAEYTAVERAPATAWYKGRKVLSAPAPAAGHIIIYMLNILERYGFHDGPSAVNYHRLVEALRYGFARRSELGDPDHLPIAKRLDEIISKDEAAAARRNISDSTSFPPEHYNPKYDNAPSHGTTHISVLDENGMAVAITTTVNLIFGSQIMEPTTGIILNDQMDDFSFRGFSNAFGLPPSPSNYIGPLKRPMSSTSPTIIEEDGEVLLVVGGSGGSRIISAVFQTVINFLEFGWSVTAAVTAPRLHDQLFPDRCEVEEGFPAGIVSQLALLHHNVTVLPTGRHESVVQAIARLSDGRLEAVSDYRKGGIPDGY